MRTKLWIGVGAFVVVQSGSAVAVEPALPASSAFSDQVGEGEYEGGEQEGGEQEGGEQEAGEGEGEGRQKVVRTRKARSAVRNPRRARTVIRQSGERGESEGGEQEGGEYEGGER